MSTFYATLIDKNFLFHAGSMRSTKKDFVSEGDFDHIILLKDFSF